jgi:transcriptional regulator with XRE-family HTH domain
MFDNVGKTLRLIRELRGESQAGIARQAGLGKTQLSKYENGKELPKLPTLQKVLTALEVGPFEFFYTMHLIDMRAANLDLKAECKIQGLPPLPIVGAGLLSNDTDAAVKRLIDDVMSLYHQMNAEKVLNPPRKN